MTPNLPTNNPYVGLRPFDSKDSLYFFGRREQTAELFDRLRQSRFLAVVGSSGCGKSSLIRAGLIPALLGGFLVDQRDKWLIAVMKPGDSPMRNLAAALCATGNSEDREAATAALEKGIATDQVDAIIDYVDTRLGRDTNLLLMMDQFEEIFSFRGNEDEEQLGLLGPAMRRERGARREEATNFVDLMMSLSAVAELPVYVVLTMRSDFLGDCDVFYGLPEAMNRSRYLVPRLTRQQLRESIQGPALLSGVVIAPRLMDTMLNGLDGRSDQLPVLQHALLRTWAMWQKDRTGPNDPIDLLHYEKIGGLKDALSNHAQEALRSEDLNTTAKVFQCLTDTDPNQRRIRRPAHLKELVAVTGAPEAGVRAIVERFNSDGRNFLVVSNHGNGDARIDISHESLIRQWAQLRDWIDAERSSRDHYLELVNSARNKRALLQEPDLQLALNWREEAQPSLEWARRYSQQDGDYAAAMDYLAQSRDAAVETARQKKRLIKLLILGVAGVIVILASLSYWAFKEELRAKKAEKVADFAKQKAQSAETAAVQLRVQANQYADVVTAKLRDTQVERPHTPKPPPPMASPVPSSVTLNFMDRNFTFRGVSLNNQGNAIQVSPGALFTISLQWDGSVTKPNAYCPACIVQLYYGIDHKAGGASKCIASDMMGPGWKGTGDVKGALSAPQTMGMYYITASTTLDYGCTEDKVTQSADPKDAIGAIYVR